VARDAAGEGKLLEEHFHPFFIFGDVRVDLAVRPFQIGIGHQCRPAVAGPGDVDHVEIVFLDDPVQVDVDEIQPGGGPPMPKQPGLDVFQRERFPEKGVVVQIDLSDRKVVGSTPVGVHRFLCILGKLFGHHALLLSNA
jgi:hypothetical protein